MYNDYFGLREAPFSIAPNPQYLFMSPRHREALAHLMYGIQSDGGFILLSGEVGTGKTTVCRCLLEQIPQDVDTAYILNPKLTAQELLATACDELKINYPPDASIKVLVDNLNAFLLDSHQEGRRTVLIIDEAQNLSVDVLEQLRLLTNLETNQRKLLQIILLGQPELLTLLAKQELRQLSQRVTARFHLDALNKEEVGEYIQHRLDIAGAKGSLFPPPAVNRVYQISKGIPRLINLVCDRALLGTYVQNKLQVDTLTINNAAKEILGERPRSKTPWLAIAASVFVLVTIGIAVFSVMGDRDTGIATQSSPKHQTSPVLERQSAMPINTEQPTLEIDSPQLLSLNDGASVTTLDSKAETATPPIDTNTTNESLSDRTTVEPANAQHITAQQSALESISNSNSKRISSSDPVGTIDPAVSLETSPIVSIEDVEGHETQTDAFSTLMKLWDAEVALNNDTDPCDVAAVSGLLCLTKLGSLRDVAHLNRPVILNLPNVGKSQWYVVSALDEKVLTVTRNDKSFQLAREQVLEVWSGYYTLIWRSPPAYRQPAKLGDRGATVDWLQTQISFVEGTPAPSIIEGTVFDAALESRVKRFQISVGLVPDGIVGAQTWIHLNSADASDIPKLRG